MDSTTTSKKVSVVLGCPPYVQFGSVIPHNANIGSFVYILPSGDIRAYVNLNVDNRTGESKYCVVFPGAKPEDISNIILKQFNLVTAIPSGKSGDKTLFKLSVSISGSKPVGFIGDHFRSLTAPYIGFAIDTQNGFTIQDKTIAVVMKNRKYQKMTMVQEFFNILFDKIYPGPVSIQEVKEKSLPKVVELQVSSNTFPSLPRQKNVVPEATEDTIVSETPVPATVAKDSILEAPVIATAPATVPVPVSEIPVCDEVMSDDDIFAYKYRLLELEMSKLGAEHFLKKLKSSLNNDFTEDERDSCQEQILGVSRDLVTFKREQRVITNILTGTM